MQLGTCTPNEKHHTQHHTQGSGPPPHQIRPPNPPIPLLYNSSIGSSLGRAVNNTTGPNKHHKHMSVIGEIGDWAQSLIGGDGAPVREGAPPMLSFRNAAFDSGLASAVAWRSQAKAKLRESLLMPALGPIRDHAAASVRSLRVCTVGGVRVEELEWQLPYGPPTKALFLRPAAWKEGDAKLPGVLALHCHGGNKVFGLEKITRTDAPQHPLMAEHQRLYYSGKAWANELAATG